MARFHRGISMGAIRRSVPSLEVYFTFTLGVPRTFEVTDTAQYDFKPRELPFRDGETVARSARALNLRNLIIMIHLALYGPLLILHIVVDAITNVDHYLNTQDISNSLRNNVSNSYSRSTNSMSSNR